MQRLKMPPPSSLSAGEHPVGQIAVGDTSIACVCGPCYLTRRLRTIVALGTVPSPCDDVDTKQSVHPPFTNSLSWFSIALSYTFWEITLYSQRSELPTLVQLVTLNVTARAKRSA
jgi:hypothetical protein